MGQIQSHIGDTLTRRRICVVGLLSSEKIKQGEGDSSRGDLINTGVLMWA